MNLEVDILLGAQMNVDQIMNSIRKKGPQFNFLSSIESRKLYMNKEKLEFLEEDVRMVTEVFSDRSPDDHDAREARLISME